MELEELTKQVDTLSLSDTLRLYLYMNKKFEDLKNKDAQHISKMIYYVKNAEKVKDRVKQNRKIKQATN
jgi:hypothetical protein